MAFVHRTNALAGVEGWIDEPLARAWAFESLERAEAARQQTTLEAYKRERRAALEAVTNATLALNLPLSQTPSKELSAPWPFGLALLDRYAGDGPTMAARAAARAQYPGDALQRFANEHPIGDYPQTAPDGTQWVLRVGPSLETDDARNVATVMPSSAAVLAYLRTAEPGRWQIAAREIAHNPWSYYVARREAIREQNERTAALWGLTTPEQVAGFQVASDELAKSLGAEWELAQREASKREADRILDRVSQYAASTGIGAPLAAVFQAVKLLTGILPWVTVEAPPPALARVRSGGVGPDPSQRPTHTVPVVPSDPLELVTTARGEYVPPVSTTAQRPPIDPGAMARALETMQGQRRVATFEPPPRQDLPVQRLETGSATAGAIASAPASSDGTLIVGGAVVAGLGLLWWLSKG